MQTRVKHPVGFGTHVRILDGDDRATASGRIIGVATWETRPGAASPVARGYVVELDSAYVGWIDNEAGHQTYVTLLTVHEDAIYPSEV